MSLLSRTVLPTLSRSGIIAARMGPTMLRVAQRRGMHIENSLYHNTPFRYDTKSAFGRKYFAVLGSAFALPFVAVYWQLRKGAGTAAKH